jgi:NADH-quinone oxidoreductase subunit H
MRPVRSGAAGGRRAFGVGKPRPGRLRRLRPATANSTLPIAAVAPAPPPPPSVRPLCPTKGDVMNLELIVAQLAALVFCFAVPLVVLPMLIWGERRVAAYIQLRLGPNRVGPLGLIQPLADVIKLVFKEDVTPNRVDRLLYTLAPLLAFVPGMIGLAIIPMGPGFWLVDQADATVGYVALQGADLTLGLLFLLAALGISAYGLTFGGWASNSKYPQLGGIRATAQVISYEIALALAVICVVMVTASEAASGWSIRDIVWSQIRTGSLETGYVDAFNWNVWRQPLACIIFIIAAFAETNRLPFDMPEAESELVAGYHTEYSSMKFAMFFMGEYLAMFVQSALIVTLFFGGWSIPGIIPVDPQYLVGLEGILYSLLGFIVFIIKTLFFLFVFMWVRWTLPRFRYDQLMDLGWKWLIPLGIANLVITALVLA